ncbi:unnamed protein product [Arctogadus glacialis]
MVVQEASHQARWGHFSPGLVMMEASHQALVVPLKTMGPHWSPSGSWVDSESPLVPLWVLEDLRSRPQQHPRPEEGGNMG